MKHHMIDVVDPDEPFSAGDFVRMVTPIILDILSRGKVPVLVGGCTMWVDWLVNGMPDAPKSNETSTKIVNSLLSKWHLQGQRCESLVKANEGDWDEAISVLYSYDPIRAKSLSRNDWYRLRRYLEVAVSKPLPESLEMQSESPDVTENVTEARHSPLREAIAATGKSLDVRCFFVVDPRRERLYREIDRRCEGMLRAGLLEEVTGLLLSGKLPADGVASKAIGYRQTVNYLCREDWKPEDHKSLLLFLRDLCTATRNYATRQLKWYRSDTQVLWMHSSTARAEVCGSVAAGKEQAVRELLHWLNVPRNEFDKRLESQVTAATANRKIKESRKRDRTPEVQSAVPLPESLDWTALDPEIRAPENPKSSILRTYMHRLSVSLQNEDGSEPDKDKAARSGDWLQLLAVADNCSRRLRDARLTPGSESVS